MIERVFVDTSALLALINASDRFHRSARDAWHDLLQGGAVLWTTNYVVVESAALVQRRIGLVGLQALCDALLPVVHVDWLDPPSHYAALAAVRAAGRGDLSLVDCASFEAMRRLAIATAFAFDTHFVQQGFAILPGQQ